MPPRIPPAASRAVSFLVHRSCTRPSTTPLLLLLRSLSSTSPAQYATAAAASSPGPLRLPDDYVPPTKPPSARPPETRKSQLIRTYTSLLRTTPLMLFFEHNNLTAVEWAAVRRELRAALAAVPPPPAPMSALTTDGAVVPEIDVARDVSLTVLRTRMFGVALKIVEFFDPQAAASDPQTQRVPALGNQAMVHDLSAAAYEAVKSAEGSVSPESTYAQLAPYMTGPTAALVFPGVWPQHLAAALSILAPAPGRFPAPTRKKSPGYYDPSCQAGLAKLRLVGGRIEGQVFDFEGVRWVGGIEGGLDGLRAQLVAVLQGAGFGVTNVLEGAGRSLWVSLEGRRMALEEEEKPAVEEKKEG